MRFDAVAVAQVLGGEALLGRRVKGLADLHEAALAGLPPESLDCVAKRVTDDEREIRRMKDRIVAPSPKGPPEA